VAGRLRRRRAVRATANDELDLNGVDNKADGVARMNAWLEAHGAGTATVNYKLRDWLFSRQRYWGEPFPIVYDVDGRPHTLPDDMLPVLLPETESFSPRTFDPDDEFSNPESPLDRLGDWVEVELDLYPGDGPQVYRRDTNVMPQWAGSCWYEMRYLDPTNENGSSTARSRSTGWGRAPTSAPTIPAASTCTSAASNTPCCTCSTRASGTRCSTTSATCRRRSRTPACSTRATSRPPRTRTNARSTSTPPRSRATTRSASPTTARPVTREWGKMGKSLKNAVSPDDMYDQYGADTLRLYEMATGPLDASRPWETRDVVGMYRFLQRLWRNVVDEESGECTVVDAPADDDTRKLLHRTIDTVRTEMDALRFNTAIAKLIELNNARHQARRHAARGGRADGDHAVALVPTSPRSCGASSATPTPSPTSRSPRPTRHCSSTTPSRYPCR
jgi:leucyl-tRNA synthetase